MSKQNVLLVDLGTVYGGSMAYMANLQRLLENRVRFVCVCVNPEAVKSLRALTLPVYSLEFFRKFGKLGQVLAAIAILPYLKFRFHAKVVWIQGIPDIVLLPFCHLLKCKTIVTRHLTTEIKNQTKFDGLKRHAAEFIYRHVIRMATRFVCVSQAVAKCFNQYIPSQKIIVIPNWVPFPLVAEDHHWLHDGPLRLLFVGRLKKHKGISLILDAMHKLPYNAVSLKIVGDGECRKDLENQAKDLDVQFVGFKHDPSTFYREADLFIHPGLGPEGLPLVSLEAMSWGLPCIFSDLLVHREITAQGTCAVLFDCGDSDDLCSKIKFFLSSPQKLKYYGRAGREMVAKQYCEDAARNCYIKELGL
jgi:glycosyltransferase involved in cell wall biosynthesis